MPLFYQHNINENTKLGIWKIDEPEAFFIASVPQHRNITHPHKRLQHLAGRYLLKHLFPDFPYGEIVIAETRKPYLPYEQYHFSISHCGAYAAAIVSNKQRVGIDAEIPAAKIENISHKFLNKVEQNQFGIAASALRNDEMQTTQLKLLTVLWSAKEAVYKWWGWGGVDFKNDILLQAFELNETGTFDAVFKKNEKHFDLQLWYKVFDELCLVWICSKEDKY